jgi:hypothetical protein
MKRFSKAVPAIVILLLGLVSPPIAHAGTYKATAITNIAVYSGGELYIRWAGDTLPDPGPCGGENYHWVVIPATASDTLKSFALSIYFSGKPAQIQTAGCSGPYELVIQLYSPGP